jgi:sulfopropanediol 3-dehydrogenase
MTTEFVKRPVPDVTAGRQSDDSLRLTVEQVIADVRERGDVAVREYSEKYDQFSPPTFGLTFDEIDAAVQRVPSQTLADIREVQDNVRRFAELQRASLTEFEAEVEPGVFLGQKNVPIDAVGAYVPGGRYPLLAAAHMTILTAKVAGVRRVAAVTPAPEGRLPDASIAAMHLAGADEIYLLGGVQAIAALALGTESIPRVDMIAGPGNAYVAEAKRQLFGEIGIDLFAGPTEILVVADETADPFLVAADLLSQAEHGPDSPAVLISTSPRVAQQVVNEIQRQLENLPTAAVAEAAWRDFGEVLVVSTIEEAFELADDYASEHVEVLIEDPRRALKQMKHYGAMFLGENTCVSFGDKAIGTNHVLPTRKAARYTGGLWVGMYTRVVTYQEITDSAASARFGELCGRASRAENFEAHARSGDIRVARAAGTRPSWAN